MPCRQSTVRRARQTAEVPRERTNRPFAVETKRLLQEQGMSIRALAERVGVSESHLSRLLRQRNYKKTPSARLARAVASELGKPPDFFAEAREGAVLEKIRSDPRLRDRLYDELAT